MSRVHPFVFYFRANQKLNSDPRTEINVPNAQTSTPGILLGLVLEKVTRDHKCSID